MEDTLTKCRTRAQRIRSGLLVLSALLLFVFGILLLFAPAPAQESQSSVRPGHFPCHAKRWIMGSHSGKVISLAGGGFFCSG